MTTVYTKTKNRMAPPAGNELRSISVVLVMLGQDYCLNSGQERMDSMKGWAGKEEEKARRSVCCVM